MASTASGRRANVRPGDGAQGLGNNERGEEVVQLEEGTPRRTGKHPEHSFDTRPRFHTRKRGFSVDGKNSSISVPVLQGLCSDSPKDNAAHRLRSRRVGEAL